MSDLFDPLEGFETTPRSRRMRRRNRQRTDPAPLGELTEDRLIEQVVVTESEEPQVDERDVEYELIERAQAVSHPWTLKLVQNNRNQEIIGWQFMDKTWRGATREEVINKARKEVQRALDNERITQRIESTFKVQK